MELLIVGAVIALLVVLISPMVKEMLISGMAAKSAATLRQLVAANGCYAADHDGSYCPAQEPRNLVRWHGGRSSAASPFDPAKGFLAPYLGESRQIKTCPLLQNVLKGSQSFENGSGGYGYNATYIGGTPADPYTAIKAANIPSPSRTIMFATTAFARGVGVQEYPYAEPYQWVDPNGNLSGPLQPSVHFRAQGRALIAWCDGHVTAELPERVGGSDYYQGDSKQQVIGWVGPERDNGYWNPNFQP